MPPMGTSEHVTLEVHHTSAVAALRNSACARDPHHGERRQIFLEDDAFNLIFFNKIKISICLMSIKFVYLFVCLTSNLHRVKMNYTQSPERTIRAVQQKTSTRALLLRNGQNANIVLF